MKRNILIGICFLIASHLSAFGCIQKYGTTVDGNYIRSIGRTGRSILYFMTNAPSTDWARDEQVLRPFVIATNASYKTLSDYSADLLHLGRTREAIAILEPLAAKYPNEYEITANLGTAYELDGQIENALKFISRGIDLNEYSHLGSEWIHVKILEAKIALAKNPNWLQTHSVLGYSFGDADIPVLPLALKGDAKENKPRKVAEAIEYQLHERLQFVHPPDPIVHDILFDLGNIVAASDIVESAIPVYKFALQFGSLRQPMIEKRIARFESLARWNVQKFAQEHTVALFFCLVIVFVAMWLVSLNIRRNKALRSSAPISV